MFLLVKSEIVFELRLDYFLNYYLFLSLIIHNYLFCNFVILLYCNDYQDKSLLKFIQKRYFYWKRIKLSTFQIANIPLIPIL